MMLVIRLLDPSGEHTTVSYRIGRVEIRPPKLDTSAEWAELEASAEAFGWGSIENCMRIVTIVEDAGRGFADVDARAAERLEEALDVKATNTQVLSRVAMLGVGAYRDLETGRVMPRRPRRQPNVTTFRIQRDAFPAMETAQFLLLNPQIDLCRRLTRSYHWSRRAHLEDSLHTRVLFRWFAMETVFSLSKNDDVAPHVLWAKGFPNREVERALPATFLARLQALPRYRRWREHVAKQLEEVKKLRNHSVHQGARFQDVSHDDLRKYDRLVVSACNRVQHLAQLALEYGLTTARDLIDCRLELTQLDPYYVMATQNLIDELEDPDPPWRMWRSD